MSAAAELSQLLDVCFHKQLKRLAAGRERALQAEVADVGRAINDIEADLARCRSQASLIKSE